MRIVAANFQKWRDSFGVEPQKSFPSFFAKHFRHIIIKQRKATRSLPAISTGRPHLAIWLFVKRFAKTQLTTC